MPVSATDATQPAAGTGGRTSGRTAKRACAPGMSDGPDAVAAPGGADLADAPVCQQHCEHTEVIARVRARLAPDEDMAELAATFRLLGDRTRVRILEALACDELCVCDLAAVVGHSQSAVSHQLRLLRAAKLVRVRRDGKNAFYTLDDDHVRHLFRQALDHVQESR
jgi:DNA-binding transcriptional ArsR family regulator